MNKRHARILLIVLATALVTAFGSGAAPAAATWTVKPGGAVTAKFSQVRLTDTRTGAPVECPSTLKVTLATGTGLSGTRIGSITSFTFGTCVGPLDFTFTLNLTHLPLTLNATSYNSGTGTTTGKVTGIHGTFVGGACSYVLDGTGASKENGSITTTYVNSTHRLKLHATGSNLHAYEVQGGCGQLAGVRNGDSLTLTGAGTVTPAQTITSP